MDTESRTKDVIQDCNLNFLLGSGLSTPYLDTLGNIERLLTETEQADCNLTIKKIVKASLYKKYFDGCISKNLELLLPGSQNLTTSICYRSFLTHINTTLLRRRSTILSKEANLFTTNIDIFLDKALEALELEYNDGFNGRFDPAFSLSNFKKSRFKKSLHFDNTAEIPVFNLVKLHGSLSWNLSESERIKFSSDLEKISSLRELASGAFIQVSGESTFAELFTQAESLEAKIEEGVMTLGIFDEFLENFEELSIVNPTKEKFKHSVLNHTYYEMLRLYSNELEKENTVLYVLGFSFSDEHLRQITIRAANSNPTLIIFVYAYSGASAKEIAINLGLESNRTSKNANILIIQPDKGIKEGETVASDLFHYDLNTFNERVLSKVNLSRL